MERLKRVWALLLSLMIVNAFFNFQIAKGQIEQAIVIMADGSIKPPSTSINRISDNYYVLIDNLINASIRVERSNAVIDGRGYTVQGTGRRGSIGIHLVSNTMNVTIKNFVVKGFFDGIQMYESSGNTITNCTVTENANCGIRFGASGDAPPERQPSNNNVIGNIITNNGHTGIQLYKSTNNYIAQNLVAYNRNYGIDLAQSSYNVFRNNTLIGNKYNFAVLYSPEFSHFINDVDTSNTVDGKPIYYLINQKNIVIDNSTHPNIGYLALVNSTDITVKWLTLQNSGQGILLAYTNNSQIINNTITNNECGIKLCHAFGNTISGNLIKDEHYGSWLEHSTNNRIESNNFTDVPTAIYLAYSPGNIIKGNIYMNVTTTVYYATPTIFIRADGSIDPPTANITTNDNVTYVFTGNIYDYSISVERDNIVLDGAGYTVQMTVTTKISTGICLTDRTNVTIKNFVVKGFLDGIQLLNSSRIVITNCTITDNECGVKLYYSSNNAIFQNKIVNGRWGIWLEHSTNNDVSTNNFVNVITPIYYATPTNGQNQPLALPPWMIAAAIVFVATAALTLLLRPKTKPRRKTSRTR